MTKVVARQRLRLPRGVYPERSVRARNDSKERKMLKIRRYRAQDNKAVKRLNYIGLEQMDPARDLAKIPFIDNDLDDIEEVYLKEGDFIVGLQNGEIVAMGAFKKRTAECAEFKRLRIRPDCQRKGYGEKIMRLLMELAAEKGYTEAFLDTLASNISAQRLFEKCGFVRSGYEKRGPFDLYYYSRKLNRGGK
jgi:ribosomal protein S18 acetylase RimI-like enzyme